MDIFKVAVAVEGREIEAFVRVGVLATIETGSHKDKVERPENKIAIIVGEGKEGSAAWVQVARFAGDRSLHITHEGWVTEAGGQLQGYTSLAPARAMLVPVPDPTPDVMKCQAEASFGAFACCTASGSGCYVRCCNSCCSDPYRCPGARCCA